MGRRQTLELRGDDDIVIETPLGMIHIRRARRRRSLALDLPGDLKAFDGVERAVENARYTRRVDGKIVPAYTLLVPVVDDTGALVNVKAQHPLRMAPGQGSPGVIRIAQQ
jgi:hypothetical protein